MPCTFPSPQLLQLRCPENYWVFFYLCWALPTPQKRIPPKISCPALLPRAQNSPYFFVELCFLSNSALPEIFRSSHDFHLQLYDLQSPDNFCADKRCRKTELFKYNKIYDNERSIYDNLRPHPANPWWCLDHWNFINKSHNCTSCFMENMFRWISLPQ